ncbi:dirigent protein 4 [Brachypodium distachyon]|uniref:Dirigent protein n=1 Tax=Brachypodium distachyon TaxID=15368 RepID=I1GLT4_BRADI|nr:dirigent protein 4 [Brachypodium distachyon]KQK12544.1 hypothetical protein BRADI_1g04410v3 [Brachypodium distachyon]|eukprot:XP_010229441.1 dirigent protein 4 [Brachypodium distachyon]
MRTPALLLLVLVAFQRATATDTDYPLGPEKVTNLHFFMHDTLSGKDPSAVLVARAAGANYTPRPDNLFPFSSVYVFNDVLTEGRERSSRVVGNAHGTYIVTAKNEKTILMAVDYQLADYQNSSFAVFTRNPVGVDGRELTVVGGHGAFRMARGFAILPSHYLNTENGDAILEYNVTLFHH